MLFSFFSNFSSSKAVSDNLTLPDDVPAWNEFLLNDENTVLTDFTLFHRKNRLTIHLLFFLPHHGMYLGEKILWNLRELQGASIKRLTRKGRTSSHTQIESTEKSIYQKLQDVLSFDSTPIERIFWMKNLTKAEFDTLDSSFHELLPKGRLIFRDDTATEIQSKLHALNEHQPTPFSKLKIIGSLRAHALLLPTVNEPFGSFLSPQQLLFLDSPIPRRCVLELSAPHGSGKSTVLIRKVMDYLLTHPDEKALIITPTRLSGELLRNEFVALMEFSAVECDLAHLHFYTQNEESPVIETTRHFLESTLIVCDDSHLLESETLKRIMAHKGSRSLILCGTAHLKNSNPYTLSHVYRLPVVNTIHFTHTRGALFTLLTGLKTHLETTSSHHIMIIVPNHEILLKYKHAIETNLAVECKVLTDTFSLQYDTIERITLSTPQFISGLSVPHSYLINLDSEDPLYYPLALSRASDTVTIISESNLEK